MDPSALETFWFVLIAVLWTGYLFLEGFDFGVGHAAADPRPRRRRAALDHLHDRPGLGRQRGVAADRRRRHVRGVPGVVRDALLRLLPGAVPDPGRADRARRGVRVPRQARHRALARHLGRGDRGRERGPRPAVGGGLLQPGPRRGARRRPRVRGNVLATCSTPTRCWAGVAVLLLCAAQGAIFLSLRTRGDLRERAHRIARPLTWAVVAAARSSSPGRSAARPATTTSTPSRSWGAWAPRSP